MSVPPPPDPCPECDTPTEWNQARCPQCNTVVHLHRVAPDELDDLTPEQMERWSEEVLAHDFYGRPYEERDDLVEDDEDEE